MSPLWELVCQRRRPRSRPFFLQMCTAPCGSWLASEGGLAADHFPTGVHIHFCGNGGWRFRSYSESLFQTPKRNQKALPSIRCLAQARHALTPALLRGPAAIGHPWPGAATAASMPRCPLRNACVRPLGKGQKIKIKIKSRSNGNGNGKINSFAGKPAPTVGQGTSLRAWSAVRPPSLASQLLQ
ncbi:hypothetical protein PS880_00068 [Pseudomonas fluorescens]|uniref:Uncharacterized protein n=1 Tax=Pseudomonas fluorescens TaxID=294 RepID=A0A5E7G4G1_PSEFL|nr:hypothetical protein PS880_00068 [Pseudomonas fluorescens]